LILAKARIPMSGLSINAFDAAVYILTILAVIMGFASGLLRSLATILGYVAAAAIAVAATPIVAAQLKLAPGQNWIALAGIFLVSGFLLGVVLRFAISELAGAEIGIGDRMIGAFIGALRILLLAVLMLLIFDRIIPADRQPAFLADSKLRPILSMAGQQGLRSLPPEITAAIDRLKKDHGI
jgi:membrane protein required for colicin V production